METRNPLGQLISFEIHNAYAATPLCHICSQPANWGELKTTDATGRYILYAYCFQHMSMLMQRANERTEQAKGSE